MEAILDWMYNGPISFSQLGYLYSSRPLVTSSGVLNPNANEFEVKNSENNLNSNAHVCWEHGHSQHEFQNPISLDGYVYMNGDVGKLPSGAAYNATPEPAASSGPVAECNMVNGGMSITSGEMINEAGGFGSPLDGSSPSTAPDSSIPIEQLKQMLSSQLEYYFSRENLANDTYLLSQMDNDQYVPIWTVANFNQVKKLTKDINLITEVLRESPNVQVDEEGMKVRPNHKRCIVILREIPDNTPVEEVKNLFSGENCPRLISCEFAHNNSWYVTFETDDDAQRAYRFLREEVQEFQGKPIMARIKAKPMHRMSLPPVGGGVKNGYRTPAPAPTGFDPNTFSTGPQRYLYTNGTPPPQYGNQMHVYQYYTPNMLQPWAPNVASPYYDIGSVFAVNGLSPQSSFKQQQARYNPRPRNKQRSVPPSEVNTVVRPNVPVSSPQIRVPTRTITSASAQISQESELNITNSAVVGHPSSSGTVNVTRPESDDGSFRQPISLQTINKETPPIRQRLRRKRDDELPPSPQTIPSREISSRGLQFDLEATAFPPLPGLEVDTQNSKPTVAATTEINSQQVEIVSQWGENRLADVVKGTVKSKSLGTKEKENVEIPVTRSESPINTLPTQTNSSSSSIIQAECKDASTNSDLNFPLAAASTINLTPPTSPPHKSVPVTAVKCTMADKSTKIDESLLNGDLTEQICPTTTNAATMTTVVTLETSRPINVSVITSTTTFSSTSPPISSECNSQTPRMSYAQVAQHHKEHMLREKNNNNEKQQQSKEKPPASSQSRVQENREHREVRGNARRTKNRSNQANRTNSKIQSSPSSSGSPARLGSPNTSQSPNQAEGLTENTDTPQTRDNGRFGGRGGGSNRTTLERSQSGPGRRRSGLEQRPQLREFLGPRSPK